MTPKNHKPDDRAADAAAGTVSTTGGDLDQEPVVVWEAANLMEAEVVKGRLQSAGIPALVRSEALGAIYGLTTGALAAADVLAPAALAAKALALLHDESTGDELDGDELDGDETGGDETDGDEAARGQTGGG